MSTDLGDIYAASETVATEPPAQPRSRVLRWRAVVSVLGISGLAIAAFTTVDNAREQALPALGPLAGALVLQVVALLFVAHAWAVLFPPQADRAAVANGLYVSQLTKYLPAGGLLQAASQVALSSQGGVASAAVRLPVFSICAVVAAATLGSGVALATELPDWARVVAGVGLTSAVLLDRRVLAWGLETARRLVHRLPDASTLPDQAAVLRCYVFMLANLAAYSAAYVVLLGDLTERDPLITWFAFAAGWGLGYVALPLPSGLGVREAALVLVLPDAATGSLLAASVAHRLLSFLAEVGLAGSSSLRLRHARRDGATARGRPSRAPGGGVIDCAAQHGERKADRGDMKGHLE